MFNLLYTIIDISQKFKYKHDYYIPIRLLFDTFVSIFDIWLFFIILLQNTD